MALAAAAAGIDETVCAFRRVCYGLRFGLRQPIIEEAAKKKSIGWQWQWRTRTHINTRSLKRPSFQQHYKRRRRAALFASPPCTHTAVVQFPFRVNVFPSMHPRCCVSMLLLLLPDCTPAARRRRRRRKRPRGMDRVKVRSAFGCYRTSTSSFVERRRRLGGRGRSSSGRFVVVLGLHKAQEDKSRPEGKIAIAAV